MGMQPQAADSMRPRNTNNFYRRNRELPSLNVNNIRQPDLVPSEPDKAPHQGSERERTLRLIYCDRPRHIQAHPAQQRRLPQAPLGCFLPFP